MRLLRAVTGAGLFLSATHLVAASCVQGRDHFYKVSCAQQAQEGVCKDLKAFFSIVKFSASHSFCNLKSTQQRVSNVRELGLQNQRQAPPSLRKSPEVLDLPNQMMRDMVGGFLYRSVIDHKDFSVAARDQAAFQKLSERIKKDYSSL
jgi:hypothetical protein